MDNIKEQIIQQINILDLVQSYLRLEKRGSRYWGLCPFHNEKSPSFCVTPGKEMYYCFGCHQGGDIFKFVMNVENIDFPLALEFLAKKAGIAYREGSQGSETGKKRSDLLDLNSKVCNTFMYLYTHDSEAVQARNYMEQRGFDLAITEKFKIGYAPQKPDWLYRFLTKKGYTAEFLAQSGLFVIKEQGPWPYFHGRVIFPISNVYGDIIGFGGRTLQDKGPKYINSPETIAFKKGENLYGLTEAKDMIRQENIFYLVEGYTDVLAMNQAGLPHTVAPLGTAFTTEQAKRLKRYSSRAVLVFDGDEAGTKAAIRSIYILERQNIETLVVQLEEGEDPASLSVNEKNKLINYLKYPINSFSFLLSIAIKTYRLTAEGKREIVRFMREYLNMVDSEVKKEEWLNILSERLKISVSAIQADIKKAEKSPVPALKPGKNAEKQPKNREFKRNTDLYLMVAVLANTQYFNLVRNNISYDDISDENARIIYTVLEDSYRIGKLNDENLIEKISDTELKEFIYSKLSSAEFDINLENIILDGIKIIKRQNLMQKRDKIGLLVKQFEKEKPWKIKELLVEKMVLDSEIEKLKVRKDV